MLYKDLKEEIVGVRGLGDRLIVNKRCPKTRRGDLKGERATIFKHK